MLSLLIGIFTFILILICVLLVLVILMQRPSADAGMGASLAGGAAESAFGGETGNVLTRVCVKCIVVFFVLTFSLFLANVYLNDSESGGEKAAPAMENALKKLDGETAKQNADAAKADAKGAVDQAKADAQKAAGEVKEAAEKAAGEVKEAAQKAEKEVKAAAEKAEAEVKSAADAVKAAAPQK